LLQVSDAPFTLKTRYYVCSPAQSKGLIPALLYQQRQHLNFAKVVSNQIKIGGLPHAGSLFGLRQDVQLTYCTMTSEGLGALCISSHQVCRRQK